MELADVPDSKSGPGDRVRVRPPPPAPTDSVGTQIFGVVIEDPNLIMRW